MNLIRTIAEVKQHIQLLAEFDTNALPKWDFAEQAYILPILGEALYQDLVEAYNNDATTVPQANLVKMCQAVIVPFAFAADMSARQIAISSGGLRVIEPDSTRKPFKWEFNNFMEEMQCRGFNAQEALIIFLRAHSADFPLWLDSPYNNPDGVLIIRDGAQLRPVIGLQQPHRSYMLLRSIFDTHIVYYAKHHLGDSFYDALNAKILSGSLNPMEETLLQKLRAACARKAMEFAAKELGIRFSDAGFTIVSLLRDSKDEGYTSAQQSQIERFINSSADTAKTIMAEVVTYLNANASATVFAEYFNSDKYTDPTKGIEPIDNSQFKGFFAM